MQAVVKGSTMPVLEIQLEQGETVISAHGELSWMSSNMQMSQTTDAGGGRGGLMNTLKRAVSGGGIFLTQYQAQGGSGLVAFAAKVPGHIVPVEIAPGRGVVVHRHGWICGSPGVTPPGRPRARRCRGRPA